MKRTTEQTTLMHQLLRELPLLENLAMRAGLHITCRAIQNAVRASGWEAAGDTERANYYAPNTEGFGAVGVQGASAPSNEELEALWEQHAGHPADFAADVLERWGGWPEGSVGYGGTHGVSVPDSETPSAGTLAHHTVKFTVGNAFYSMTPEQASLELQEVYERREIDWGTVDEELRQIMDEAYRKDVLPDLRALLRRVSGR